MEELDVLTKELDNVDRVYLYNRGNELMAYEQSAYFLWQMNLAESVSNEVFPRLEVIIAAASVRADVLMLHHNKYRMVCRHDSVELDLIDGQLDREHFVTWKAKLQLKTEQ